jgi:hypothetical protein
MNEDDVVTLRDMQAQLLAGDTFDTAVGCPGALLEAQTAPFDVQLIALADKLLVLNKQFTAAVLGIDRRNRGTKHRNKQDNRDHETR